LAALLNKTLDFTLINTQQSSHILLFLVLSDIAYFSKIYNHTTLQNSKLSGASRIEDAPRGGLPGCNFFHPKLKFKQNADFVDMMI
jgi:hypothetical protein